MGNRHGGAAHERAVSEANGPLRANQETGVAVGVVLGHHHTTVRSLTSAKPISHSSSAFKTGDGFVDKCGQAGLDGHCTADKFAVQAAAAAPFGAAAEAAGHRTALHPRRRRRRRRQGLECLKRKDAVGQSEAATGRSGEAPAPGQEKQEAAK